MSDQEFEKLKLEHDVLKEKYAHACDVAGEAAESMRCARITIEALVREQDECYAALKAGGYKLEAHDRLPEKISNILVVVNSASDVVNRVNTSMKELQDTVKTADKIALALMEVRDIDGSDIPELVEILQNNVNPLLEAYIKSRGGIDEIRPQKP